ncbi:M20 family metallopeptidase [Vibrio sp. SS-MA-C1-2]|uniref:M20 family metallopeptidase n=1 Tax=Vibrio sp. SS-MA-C1-2 TaxID=2908646 RepID=UPI001F33A85B|nr:M20 family metallopeptidase [Vibrio sp. SS-MA-C1-2]UJF16925.1 M20 family metallopeptidase [Vibrio sp. SS-MA-C1-2]
MSFDLTSYIEELRALVNVDCGTLNVDGINNIAAQMSEKYQAFNWQIKEVALGDAGKGLEIRNKPETKKIDLMLLGHMDTVFPVGTVAERPMTMDETRIYGPGCGDMKTGLLTIVHALKMSDPAVLDNLSICVVMNPDEEIGSTYSKEWITEIAKKSSCALVAEAGRYEGSLVKARKGMARYNVKFSGVAAHSGNDPEKGRSAISEMANWIVNVDKLSNLESGTTLNVGVVSGGVTANVVADSAEAVVDLRYWDNSEYQDIHGRLMAMAETSFVEGTSATITQSAFVPAMSPSTETEKLMKLVEKAGENVNIPITWMACGGGSDANTTASLGIPTLDGMSSIGGGFHSTAEYVEIDSIEPRIMLLKETIRLISEKKKLHQLTAI